MALLAVAAPAMVAEAVRDALRSGEDAGGRLPALLLEGERDEARRMLREVDARRTSPNPLDVRCTLGCGSPAGHPCCDDCPEVTS